MSISLPFLLNSYRIHIFFFFCFFLLLLFSHLLNHIVQERPSLPLLCRLLLLLLLLLPSTFGASDLLYSYLASPLATGLKLAASSLQLLAAAAAAGAAAGAAAAAAGAGQAAAVGWQQAGFLGQYLAQELCTGLRVSSQALGSVLSRCFIFLHSCLFLKGE